MMLGDKLHTKTTKIHVLYTSFFKVNINFKAKKKFFFNLPNSMTLILFTQCNIFKKCE
jgi:hypothetical protein